MFGATDDLSVGFTETNNDFDPLDHRAPPSFPRASDDVYTVRDGGRTLEWQSRPNGEVADGELARAEFKAASSDGGKVLFMSPSRLLPGSETQIGGSLLYMRSGGQTRLISAGDGVPPVNVAPRLVEIRDLAGFKVRAWCVPRTPTDLDRVAFVTP